MVKVLGFAVRLHRYLDLILQERCWTEKVLFILIVESTELCKHFADQGVRIPIKKKDIIYNIPPPRTKDFSA
jgi:phage-related holin